MKTVKKLVHEEKSAKEDAMEVRFDLPEILHSGPDEIERLRALFKEKIINPFNDIFAEYKTGAGVHEKPRQCFELTTDCGENEFAFGWLLNLLQDIEEEDDPVYYLHFYFDGTATIKDGKEDREVRHGTWNEMLIVVLDFIKTQIGRIETSRAQLHKLEAAIRLLIY